MHPVTVVDPPPVPTGPGCEAPGGGWLAEPVSAWTSLAFVVAALVLVARARRGPERSGHGSAHGSRPGSGAGPWRDLLVYAVLVAGVGVGSFVEHGPDPWWAAVAHDVPLLGTLAFLAADAVADLTGRRRRWWWWGVPTAALVPVALLSAPASTLAQVVVAVVAIGAAGARAWARPVLRTHTAVALGLLAVGSAVGTLSRAGGPLCDPESLWQGHGAWHVLAAAALVVMGPTVGSRGDASGRIPRRARDVP